jgi:hypothetical protein
MGFAAKERLYRFNHLGHAGHAADQNNLIDFTGRHAGILERRPAGIDGAIDQRINQRFELGAGQLDIEMLGPTGIRRNEGQIDFRLHRVRQFDLGGFRRVLETLQRELVLA